MGGKHRIAARLAAAMKADGALGPWAEPFMGGGNMTPALVAALGPVGAASDTDCALMAMWQAAKTGWTPPNEVTESYYAAARAKPEADPLHGFCAFGCSFAGKKWGGFARGADGRNYAAGSAKAVRRTGAALALVQLLAGDYAALPAEYSTIYCDPPYAGTTGYGGAFDHARFWAWCAERAAGARVYVSEYTCPIPHVLMLELPRNLEMHSPAGRSRIERLFRVLPAVRPQAS